jgi:hypothetical protein
MRVSGKDSEAVALVIQEVRSSYSGRTVGVFLSLQAICQYNTDKPLTSVLSQIISYSTSTIIMIHQTLHKLWKLRGVIKWHKQIPALSPCYPNFLNKLHMLLNKYKQSASQIRNFVDSPLTSYLKGWNTSTSTLFPNAFSFQSRTPSFTSK